MMTEVSVAAVGRRRSESSMLRVTAGTLTLDDMLGFVGAAAHTGVLHVQADRAGSFTFDAGSVVGASVDGGADVLDLVRRRTGCDLETGPLGGAYEHDMVDAAILEHAVDVLLELEIATSGDATLDFVDAGPAGVGEDAPRLPGTGLDVADLLAAKQSRVREWKAIATAMPPASSVLRVVADLPPSGVMLRPDDWRVLGALRGGGTVAHVVRVAGIGAFSACRSLRHLLDAGAVVVEQSSPEPDTAPAPTDARPFEHGPHRDDVTDKGTS
jgi:hypothetical protein